MRSIPEVVITGVGVVSPIGIGVEAFWRSLREGRSGIGGITLCDCRELPIHLAGEVRGFEPKQMIRPRKSIKLMSRTIQFGVAAALMAWEHAGLEPGQADPDRVGTVYGVDSICTPVEEGALSYIETQGNIGLWAKRSIETASPLGLLRILPNLATCHVSIAVDARGPNNTYHQGDVSSLMALGEAVRVIQRGGADVMTAGGTSSLTDAFDWARSALVDELSPSNNGLSDDDHGAAAPRPFSADRDGQVRGEGAAAFVLESRRHAEARGADVLARVLGFGAAYCGSEKHRSGLGSAIAAALRDAGLSPQDVGHVNAHGLGTRSGDFNEARTIREVLNGVPVTAPKSYFGNLAAAGGAVETAVSLLAVNEGQAPHTLNVSQPDPACPIRLVVQEPLACDSSVALIVNETSLGQAAALMLAGP